MLLLQGSRVGSGQRVRVSSSELLALIKFEACGPAEPRPERPIVILVNLGIIAPVESFSSEFHEFLGLFETAGHDLPRLQAGNLGLQFPVPVLPLQPRMS